MKAVITSIGNSKGIRIPAAILKQCALQDEVEMEVRQGKIIISPATPPRHGWGEALAASTPQHLIINDAIDLDDDDWQW